MTDNCFLQWIVVTDITMIVSVDIDTSTKKLIKRLFEIPNSERTSTKQLQHEASSVVELTATDED